MREGASASSHSCTLSGRSQFEAERPHHFEPTTSRFAAANRQPAGAHPMSATKIVTRDRFVAGADAALLEGHEKCVLAYLMSGRDACDKFLHRVSAGVFSVPH